MIRLFAALAIPPEIAEGLARRQHGLDGARWRPLEALHITLRFAGNIPETLADDFDAALTGVTGAPLDIALAGVGAFGEGPDIDVLWAGVEANPRLEQLASRCERAARRSGIRPDKRVWRPHVTLAYLNRPDPTVVAAWIQANNLLRSPPFRVSSFGLYSSWPGETGSSYRLERTYPLSR